MNYLTIDSIQIVMFIQDGPKLISAPFTIVISFVLIYLEVEILGIVAPIILIIALIYQKFSN